MIEFSEVSKSYPGSKEPVVRDEALEAPEIEEPLNEVTESLDLETVQELNSRVDDDKEDPENVAAEYLEEEGLVE